MPSPSLLQARRALRSSRPQSASCNILAHRSPQACFYLILATLNYFNLSSVFILHYHAFNPLPIFYLFLSYTNRRCDNLPEMSARACGSIHHHHHHHIRFRACFPLPRVGLFDKSSSKTSSPLRAILRVSRVHI